MKKHNVLLVFLVALVAVPSIVRGDTLTVCTDGCDFSTIQSAVVVAQAGDTIIQTEVGNFSDEEHFTLYDVSLVVGEGLGPELCEISFDPGPPYLYGIDVYSSDEIEISGFCLREKGIWVGGEDGGNFLISNLIIVDTYPDNGISAYHGPGHALIEDVSVYNASHACVVHMETEVRDCIFTGNYTALAYSSFPDGSLYNHDNLFWDNDTDYKNITRGPDEFNADPLLDTNLIPNWGSPAIGRATDGETLGGVNRDYGAFPLFFSVPNRAGPEGERLYLTNISFAPGDEFCLVGQPSSDDPYSQTLITFVALDAYGQYWFWDGSTSWTQTPAYHERTYQPRLVDDYETILEFIWPEGAGSGSGIYFHSITTDSELNPWNPDIELYTVSFGYTEE